ncbi:hypothetical protein [Salisaeta longa]|uniref:hypothetical protein n=1 Tax=Salisaeta longa TaxID=503170 RepID=UPI0003B6294D|nr:hypothetical protein [Salisaeta longa]
MTIHPAVQNFFDEAALSREAVACFAKAAAQQIIDESQSTAQPLRGLVYDVSTGFYDDGTPQCSIRPDASDPTALVFEGQFRVNDSEDVVARRKVFSEAKALDMAQPSLDA